MCCYGNSAAVIRFSQLHDHMLRNTGVWLSFFDFAQIGNNTQHIFGRNITNYPKFYSELVWFVAHILNEWAPRFVWKELFIYRSFRTWIEARTAQLHCSFPQIAHSSKFICETAKRIYLFIIKKLFRLIVSLNILHPHSLLQNDDNGSFFPLQHTTIYAEANERQ